MKKYLILILIQSSLVACTSGGFKSLSSLVSSSQLSSSSTPEPLPSPSVATQASRLGAQSIVANQWLQQGSIQLKLQTDGNLVMSKDGGVLWSSHTAGRDCSSGCVASLNDDGNITLSQNGKLYFQTSTGGNSNASFSLQAQAPHFLISNDKGQVSVGNATSCQISIGTCPAHSELAQTSLIDGALTAQDCATRTQNFYDMCGGAEQMPGQTFSSTFYTGEVAAPAVLVGGALEDLKPDLNFDISAHATTDKYGFTMYMSSFPLPASAVGVVGFHGDISAGVVDGQQGDVAYDLLVTVGASPKACPLNGRSYTGSYDLILSDFGLDIDSFNNTVLSTFILKGVHNDQRTIPINFSLPAAVPVSGCMFVILDGGFIGFSHLNLAANLSVDLVNHGRATAQLVAPGDEFCTGVPNGTACGQANSPRLSGESLFARSVQIKTKGKMLGLYGTISQGTLPDPLPSAPWGGTHAYYLDRNCSTMPESVYGDGDYSSQIAKMTLLAKFQLNDTSGNQSVRQSMIYQSLFVDVNAGDCLIHVLSIQNATMPMSTETQIHALIQTGLVTDFASRPSSTNTDIFRFFNSNDGTHLFSILASEVSSNPWSLENNGAPVFHILNAAGASSSLLYRCVNNGNGQHLLTTDPACEGQQKESVMGSILQRQKSNSSALYRFFDTVTGDHLITTDINEGLKSGQNLEGIMGYAPN